MTQVNSSHCVKKASHRTGSRGLITQLPQGSRQTGQGPEEAEWIPHSHNTEHQKLMEQIKARKLAQDLERRNVLPLNQSRKSHLWKCSQIHIWCLCRIPEKGASSGRSSWSRRGIQQGPVQIADVTPCTIWHQLHAHKTARSSTSQKKGCHATWKLDLQAPTAGTSIRISPVLSSLQCLHKGTGKSEQQWLNRVLILADNRPIYKEASDTHVAVTTV